MCLIKIWQKLFDNNFFKNCLINLLIIKVFKNFIDWNVTLFYFLLFIKLFTYFHFQYKLIILIIFLKTLLNR